MQTVDCSRRIETEAPVYPGTEAVSVEPVATREPDGYRTTRLDVDTHTGTHVDAPAHLVDGPSIADYPLETFRFDAVLADVRPLEPRERIGPDLLASSVPDAVDGSTGVDGPTLLVVRTGWEDHWGFARYFDHPYVAAEAAEWAARRGLHVGLDAMSPDPTPSERAPPDEPDGFPAHRALFAADRLLLENLRGLEAVPDRFTLHAYPLSLDAPDAAPVRAVAHLE